MTVIKRLKRLAAGLAGLARPRNWNRPGVAAALLAVSQVSQAAPAQGAPAPDTDAISGLDAIRAQLKDRDRAAAAAPAEVAEPSRAEVPEISPADVSGPSPRAGDARMPGLLDKGNDVVAQWGDFRDFRNF